MNKIRPLKIQFVSTFVFALLLAGCGGGGGGGSSNASAQSGTVRVALTDAPACGFDAVNVTVSKVRIHQSSTADENSSGWSDITLDPAQKINLLTLTNGLSSELGLASLPAGHYTQVRLVLVPNTGASPFANSVVPTGGSETALATPSGVQSGIKLAHEFDVAPNQTFDLVLDFDACKSVVATGNGGFSLKPVINVVSKLTSGSITGFVSVPLGSEPVVSAQINGAIVKSTVPDSSTGAFTLYPLAKSSTNSDYTVVVTANGRATVVITGVPVTAGAIVAVSGSGGATPPITPQTSATHTVSGTVSPFSAEGTVRATQDLAPTSFTLITAKSKAAALTTGAYSLTLPIAAPFVGQYGSGTLPIALSQVIASIGGKYSIEASATGFQTQTISNVDVTGSDVILNFVL